MKESRHFGLNARATEISHQAVRCTPYKEIDGWSLYEYILPGGAIVREFVQKKESGPVYFTALADDAGWIDKTLWTADEIAERLK